MTSYLHRMTLSFPKLVVDGHYGIRDLIMDILVLDAKLQNVDGQSIYFKWAVDANLDRLVRLKKRYEGVRVQYNSLSIDDLLSRIKREEEFVIPPSFPLHGKQVLRGRQMYLISKYRDFLSLKSEVPELPPSEELKDDEGLIQTLTAL